MQPIPELLAPAGSLDAVRAALGNGADAIYLGAEKWNARDDGAQLSMDDLEQSCRLAHAHGARVYLTFNILFKPAELRDAAEQQARREGKSVSQLIRELRSSGVQVALVEPGSVHAPPLDHTSLLQLLADKFAGGRPYSDAVALRQPFLSPSRRC